MLTVTALFVDPTGPYPRLPGVEVYALPDRDARDYTGPHPVVAHPPCAAWGRFSKPTPESTARGPLLGDDDGCFEDALSAVELFGGVLEHPKDSKAWRHPAAGTAARPLPVPGGWKPGTVWRTVAEGWTKHDCRPGWSCLVEQGHYGHAARKPTWLYWCPAPGFEHLRPPPLYWGPSDPPPIGTGARRGNLESMSKRQRRLTPDPFARLLVALARYAGGEAWDPTVAVPT